ncbi:Ncam2p [Desmophyllum pertusum]|uniref:Ncam2p n=1 Tax=Desmophyllum pertusum TaxID=174260 RepID=A0A9W9Z402_9CNID|nr:Ncam2p [Desmophyllum pertusum]
MFCLVSQQSSPKFYTNPAGLYTLATGDRFYLNCTAGGRPVPEIIWYRNKVLITDAGDRFQLQKHNRTLRLGSLGSSSHDGTYKCVAQSGLLKVESSFTIKVINKVTPIYSTDYPLYDIRAAKHGESVTLSCNATGDSINSRTWYYNGQEINSRFANRWTVESSTGDLTLSNLQLKDFGLFHCVAKNPVSEDHRVTFLVVTGAPIPPMTVKTTSCANYSTNLTWTVFLRPDLPPPVSFIIERAFKQQSYGLPISSYAKLAEVSASTRSYVVNNLEPHHEFSFRIRARNQMGVGFPRISAFPSCATNSKRPSKFPENVGNLPIAFDGFLNISWTINSCFCNTLTFSLARLLTRRIGAAETAFTDCFTVLTPQTRPRVTELLLDVIKLTWVFRDCNQTPFMRFQFELRIARGLGRRVLQFLLCLDSAPPNEPPAGLTILRVNADSVELEWSPLYAQPPKTLDGYWIYAWTGPIRLTQDVFRLEDAPLRAVLIIPDDAIRVQVAVRGVARGVVTELDPWTKYNMVVRGYNSGGLGPFSVEIISVTTLDSKDSYYILSLRITSETFTEDLKDETSSKFKTLKANITGEVSKLYEKTAVV